MSVHDALPQVLPLGILPSLKWYRVVKDHLAPDTLSEGGELAPEGQARREDVRLQAAAVRAGPEGVKPCRRMAGPPRPCRRLSSTAL
jgi:hypothetical protein